MKKLMILAVLAGGVMAFGSVSTAQADHCIGGRSYGYGFPGRSWGSGYNTFPGSYYGGYRGGSSFGYYSPGLSISFGRGGGFYNRGWGGFGRGGWSGHRHGHHHGGHHHGGHRHGGGHGGHRH